MSTQDKTKHTIPALPWKVGKSSGDRCVGITIYRDDGPGENWQRVCRNVASLETAELIVKSANSHQQLVDALNRAASYIHEMAGQDEYAINAKAILEQIHSALDAAKEK